MGRPSLEALNVWLPRLGSNQGLQLQRLTCYRYTTGQCQIIIALC